MQIRLNDSDMFDGLERSAVVIAVVLRMLLGLGLAVALVLKVYMIVLTDLTCDPAGASLGNAIRCVPVLDLVAGVIVLVTGLGLAAALISPGAVHLRETLVMALCGVAIGFVSGLSAENASWEFALVLIALFAPIAALIVLGKVLDTRKTGSDAMPDPD